MNLICETQSGIGELTGKTYFVQQEPRVVAEPVMEPDANRPTESAGATLFGTVLHDGGRYRMWYHAWPVDWDGKNPKLVAYADSDDGITWKKPDLNLVEYHGKSTNLCNLNITSPAVFVDPHADSAYRYRATGYSSPNETVAGTRVERSGYYTAHSADGIYWELDSPTPQWDGADVITSYYHTGRGQGVVSLKRPHLVSGIPRRSIWQASYENGLWSPAVVALLPDEYDDICAKTRGFASSDYYGMGTMEAGEGALGFIWQFRHTLPRTTARRHGVFGAVDVTLAFQQSRGSRWIHVPGRREFLRHGTLGWNRGGVYTASTPVDCGNEQRLYFNGSCQSHGWYVDSEWKTSDKWRKHLIRTGIGRIGYAAWPKYRLMEYVADPEGSFTLDPGHASAGNSRNKGPWTLFINYKAEPGGFVCPELLGAGAERAAAKAVPVASAAPLIGDELREPVRWRRQTPDSKEQAVRASDELIHANHIEEVRFRIRMERATVFSYDFVPT